MATTKQVQELRKRRRAKGYHLCNVWLPKLLVKESKIYAKRKDITFSEFIERALLHRLGRKYYIENKDKYIEISSDGRTEIDSAFIEVEKID